MTDNATEAQIKALREKLDQVDTHLVELAARRQQIVSEIGRVKQGEGRQLRDFRRERQVIDRVRSRAAALGLDPTLAESLLKSLIEASLARQEIERGQLAGRGRGRKSLVIGGAGLMGRWMVEFLDNQGFDVRVSDPADSDGSVDWRTMATGADVIVVATPILPSASIIAELAKGGSTALVFDIASIKTPLIEALRGAALAGLRVCSIHPMFGPDTRLLSGRNVLVMDVGCPSAVEDVRMLFVDTMAEVRQIDLDDHDRLVALVLGLSHAVNIAFFTALERSGVEARQLAGISSTTFKRQLAIARDVAGENPGLYYEIQQLNEHGVWARDLLKEACQSIIDHVDGDDAREFAGLMLRGREFLTGLDHPRSSGM
jgi:chorismate mutase / prephenate dehydrogenase